MSLPARPRRPPVEAKANAAPAGSLAGAVIGLLGYALGTWVYRGPVPDDVQQVLLVVVPGVLSAAGAYAAARRARHTFRTDPAALAQAPPDIRAVLTGHAPAAGEPGNVRVTRPPKVLRPPTPPAVPNPGISEQGRDRR